MEFTFSMTLRRPLFSWIRFKITSPFIHLQDKGVSCSLLDACPHRTLSFDGLDARHTSFGDAVPKAEPVERSAAPPRVRRPRPLPDLQFEPAAPHPVLPTLSDEARVRVAWAPLEAANAASPELCVDCKRALDDLLDLAFKQDQVIHLGLSWFNSETVAIEYFSSGQLIVKLAENVSAASQATEIIGCWLLGCPCLYCFYVRYFIFVASLYYLKWNRTHMVSSYDRCLLSYYYSILFHI